MISIYVICKVTQNVLLKLRPTKKTATSQENININPNINPDHQNCHVIRWKSSKIYD